jgi:hypothetical protein
MGARLVEPVGTNDDGGDDGADGGRDATHGDGPHDGGGNVTDDVTTRESMVNCWVAQAHITLTLAAAVAPVLVALAVALLVACMSYSVDSDPSILRAVQLAPLAEGAWAWVPASIRDGSHTWLPWPDAPLDRWYLADTLHIETLLWGVSGAARCLATVHTTATVTALGVTIVAMSPLGDKSDEPQPQSPIARVFATAAVISATGLLALVCHFSDEAWAYSPIAYIPTAVEFVLGHVINLLRVVLFSHLADTVRILTTFVSNSLSVCRACSESDRYSVLFGLFGLVLTRHAMETKPVVLA